MNNPAGSSEVGNLARSSTMLMSIRSRMITAGVFHGSEKLKTSSSDTGRTRKSFSIIQRESASSFGGTEYQLCQGLSLTLHEDQKMSRILR